MKMNEKSSAANMEATLMSIAAMRYQEETGYITEDWLQMIRPDGQQHAVDVECRSVMISWCLEITKFCKVDPETVEIAVSFMDRFMSSEAAHSARKSRLAFQLVCMTALYTAAKINEPKALSPNLFARFSEGIFTAQDITNMELKLLQALQWRVNPPTISHFVHQFLELIPDHLLNDSQRSIVTELTLQQARYSVTDYQFVMIPASGIAYSSMINALECCCCCCGSCSSCCQCCPSAMMILPARNVISIATMLSRAIALDKDSPRVLIIQAALYKSIASQLASDCPTTCSSKSSKKERRTSTSSECNSKKSHSQHGVRTSPRAVTH